MPKKRSNKMTSVIFREKPETDGILKQYALGNGSMPSGVPIIRFLVDFDVVKIGAKDSFVARYKGLFDPKLDIYIDSDCVIELTLIDKNWKWSNKFQAITTKKPRSSIYKSLRYIDKRGAEVEWTPNMTDEYRSIRFYALLQSGPSIGHGFCLNVDYAMLGAQWLPVTIDPDIINPRPGGQLLRSLLGGVIHSDETNGIPFFALGEGFDVEPDHGEYAS
jgi:hypothetical protein